jgi:hypothetical protein
MPPIQELALRQDDWGVFSEHYGIVKFLLTGVLCEALPLFHLQALLVDTPPEGARICFSTKHGYAVGSLAPDSRQLAVAIGHQSQSRFAPPSMPTLHTSWVNNTAASWFSARVFLARRRAGKAEWVDVKTGATSGNLFEVFGELREGDRVALRGTDECEQPMLRRGVIRAGVFQ